MCMRTTLTLDDDVLEAVKGRAAAEGRTAGQVLSDLARSALTRPVGPMTQRNGLPVVPARDVPVTSAVIDDLRAEEGV